MTPQRHFSHTIWRSDAAQLWPTPFEPSVDGMPPFGARVIALSFGTGAGVGAENAGAELGAVDDAEVLGEGDGDMPRSFCAMLGTSRRVGVQYCGNSEYQRCITRTHVWASVTSMTVRGGRS